MIFFQCRKVVYYREATWLVGIAQLTHHEVRSGGKHPETGRFCPHRGPSGELIAQYRPPMSFCFYPTLYLRNHLFFISLIVLETTQRIHLSQRLTASNQLNLSLWWRPNIYLWRHNGARRHARDKHYEYFMLKNCTKATHVYCSKDPIELLFI